jgi:amidase
MTLDEFQAHDAVALAALVAAGEASVRELAEASIRAIERRNPRINAVVAERFEAALAQTDRMDGARPDRPGPLWGVPFLLKDVNLSSSDLPTRFASRFFAEAKPGRDSTLVRRWREAGLVTLGTSNTPEFAGDFTTEPLAYGLAANPWDAGVTVGGSSGGAAAAVAAGMVPLAHGTDLGGSIRIPAACCGVFGFKPSVGLNPLGPQWEEIAGGLDADHVLARSVRDSAASLDVTAGPDAGTRVGRAGPPGGFLRGLDAPGPSLRIGLCLEDAAGRRAGAAQPPRRSARPGSWRRWAMRGVPPLPRRHRPRPLVRRALDAGPPPPVRSRAEELGRAPMEEELEPMTWALLSVAERLSALDHLRARLEWSESPMRSGASMEGLDVVLTPALAEDPPPLGALTFVANGADLDRWNARGLRFAPAPRPRTSPASRRGLPVEIGAAACRWRCRSPDGRGTTEGAATLARAGGGDGLPGSCARRIGRS